MYVPAGGFVAQYTFSGPVPPVSSRSNTPPQPVRLPVRSTQPPGEATSRSSSPLRSHVSVKRSAPCAMQTPLAQVRPALHATPHAPQFITSVRTSTQRLAQLVCPVGHTQVPLLLQPPPEGVVQLPEVRGVALQVVLFPADAHTTVPVC